MTEQAIVVRGVGAAQPPAPMPSIPGVGGALPEVLQLCNAIADAGDLVPASYRKKPGAVLLAKMWADRHGVDVFTAIQNLDVIDGKPWVKTAMRVELATAKGFEFRVTESTAEVCTVDVIRPDKTVAGSITARYADRDRRLRTSNNKPTPWALHPDDMLFAEACRKADRRYVKTAAALVDAGQDYEDDAQADLTQTVADPGPAPDPATDPPEAAEAAAAATEPAASGSSEAIDEESLRAALKAKRLKVGDALRYLKDEQKLTFGTVGDVAGDEAAAKMLMAWIGKQP